MRQWRQSVTLHEQLLVVQPTFMKIQPVVVRARANLALERTPLRGDAQLGR
jgi:hypothetical protein